MPDVTAIAGKQFALAGDDKVVPFHVPELEVRGRAVLLGPMLNAILTRHAYPDAVSRLLGEVIVLTVLLGTSLKFDGRFTLQTQSDGPVSLLVVDFKTPNAVRAYARYDEEKLDAAIAGHRDKPEDLLGNGILAMTIDQGARAQRYQGIVQLEGASLEEVAQAYFRQSEQIPTQVRLAFGESLSPAEVGSDRSWRAGGVLVQFLPENEASLTTRDLPGGDHPEGVEQPIAEERNDLWIETHALIETISDDELTDPSVGSERLLYRLFHEHGVLVFDGPTVADKCSCSRRKIVDVLKSMPAEELAESWEEGEILSNCEFCGQAYRISRSDLS